MTLIVISKKSLTLASLILLFSNASVTFLISVSVDVTFLISNEVVTLIPSIASFNSLEALKESSNILDVFSLSLTPTVVSFGGSVVSIIGWIFLDYRNDLDQLSSNNIIYGHRRYNESMFGTLKNVLTKDWLNKTENHIIKISTLNNNYLFQVFSVYSVPNENYYLQTEFKNDEEFMDFINAIVNRSIYNFNTEVNKNTKILTLSTCHGDNDRLVVHSKLIKATKK